MKTCSTNHPSLQQHELARERLLSCKYEPAFYADWMRVLFIHFGIDPRVLQQHVPFELDLYHGQAFVSLVAFRMENLRPHIGGKWLAPLFRPITTHNFLNLRTYVRHRDEPGIYFISELVSNRLAVPLGPPLYGLPYHFGKLHYEISDGHVAGTATTTTDGSLSYSGLFDPTESFRPVERETPEAFLMERYSAFMCWRNQKRFFRIWHEPWEQLPVNLRIEEASLLNTRWPWLTEARMIGANYSPGLRNIWMGRPHVIRK